MDSNAVKSAIALTLSFTALGAILAKFEMIPGVHLGMEKGKLQLRFDPKQPGGDSGPKESQKDSGAKKPERDSSAKEPGGDDGKPDADGLTKDEDLRLRGLFHTGRRALAIINDQTFAQGDVLKVDYRGEKIHLRCEQIRTNSVLVSGDRMTGTVELFPEGRRTQIKWTGTAARSVAPPPASSK